LLNGFSHCHELLLKRLRELAAAQIQLWTGSRQVGKTTLLLA
jgi:predicted AAA+ superfamily ATPase